MKPCPFCGEEKALRIFEAMRIKCASCGSFGPFGKSVVEAKKRWNARVENHESARPQKTPSGDKTGGAA